MILDSCPNCKSNAYKRNGFTRHGKQNHRCLDCGRQFSFEIYSVEQIEDANYPAYVIQQMES